MSSKKLNPFKDFQSDQIQRSSRKIFTAHYACRNAALNLTPVTGTTNGFIFQIISSLIESWGVRLTWFDCNSGARLTLQISFSWKSHENKLKTPWTFFMAMKTAISDFMVLNYVMKFPWNSLPVIFMNHEKLTKPWIWIFMGHESLFFFGPIHFMTPEKTVTA